jgi:hypothetical protein
LYDQIREAGMIIANKPQLVEGVYNTRIDIGQSHLLAYMAVLFNHGLPGAATMVCLSTLHDHLRRWEAVTAGLADIGTLVEDCRANYATFLADGVEIEEAAVRIKTKLASGTDPQHDKLREAHAQVKRFQSVALSLHIILNISYSVMDSERSADLEAERQPLILAAIAAGHSAASEAPLGATDVSLPLCAAYLGTESFEMRYKIKGALQQWCKGTPRAWQLDEFYEKLDFMKSCLDERLRPTRSAAGDKAVWKVR